MSLDRIVALANVLVQQQQEVKRLDQRLKDAKEAMLRTEREDLPSLMSEAGLTQIQLADGATVKIVEDCDARITDATRPQALQWLLENNFGGLIKTNVSLSFGRGEHETAVAVREELARTHDGVELKEDVHYQTLKAFVKEQLAMGTPIPMDLFNVYPYTKAVIK